jgi:D-sedoheptulose 7-phosphate isomerase
MNIEVVERSFLEHEKTLLDVKAQLQQKIFEAGNIIKNAIKNGQTLFLCGNGGSAADAQHIAAEFTGRFLKEREGLPAIALTTDTSALTAIGNDYGFSRIFSRQIEALGKSGDVLIAISTSGNSENVLEAITEAKRKKMLVLGLTGKDGGKMELACNVNIIIPSAITARIQEMHILIGHIFCEMVDSN